MESLFSYSSISAAGALEPGPARAQRPDAHRPAPITTPWLWARWLRPRRRLSGPIPCWPRPPPLPRHRQDQEAELFRGKPDQRGKQARELAPSMSSLILISHVKEGWTWPGNTGWGEHRRYHPPAPRHQPHQLFLPQGPDPGAKPNQAKMEDYRYPGPRPRPRKPGWYFWRTRWRRLRTLTDPTRPVSRAWSEDHQHVFADGQLDECELTLKTCTTLPEASTRS